LRLAVVVTIGLVGGIGGLARFMLDDAVSTRLGREFPYGTLAVNLLGAFVLGALVGAAIGHNAYRLAGTGLIGAFTTFSTWAFESHRLGEAGRLRFGVMNFALSLVLGVTAAWAGRHAGGWL
jgi:fluoride exporter